MTSSNNTVVVTGASGFLAAWILPKLVARGIRVVAVDIARDETRLRQVMKGPAPQGIIWERADLTTDGVMSRIAEQYAASTILHLAALQIPACKANPIAGAKVNVVGHVGVLEAARGVGARVVYTSSVAAKPRGAAKAPANLYGVFKRADEEISRLYAEDFGVASFGLRPHVVYGIGRDQGETSAVTSAMRAAAFGVGYTVPWTTATCFQFADDIAEMFVRVVESEWSGAHLADMTDVIESTADIIAAIRASAPEADVQATGPERLSPTAGFDVAALEQVIGPRPQTPLSEGVRRTIQHFRELRAKGLA
ncbi:MAG TPA: NAD(P)-dependent oxidoreductase [Hyphomicrobiaceae bacterium]|nr:NAD(P)-dependent oxidoreductase [Hyphomicrobiaceae bacterium]